jgi:Raf kinase inhibitor-like YbhB/YbcL family protein
METQQPEPRQKPLRRDSGKVSVLSDEPEFSSAAPIRIESAAFVPGGRIPERFAKADTNISPPLAWTAGHEGTREFLIVCEDPDAPRLEPYIHWILFQIPAEVLELPEGIPAHAAPKFNGKEARQAKNSAGTVGYSGPHPPQGHGIHHYHFQIFALDRAVSLSEAPSRQELLSAVRGHVTGMGVMIGTYRRDAAVSA